MKLVEKWFPFLVLVGLLINANGLLNEILEPDGALYAAVSKHIALTGDWKNLFAEGHDWLDKPHFPFWVTALSFRLFGVSAFAYKLPAFLFWLAGIAFTYSLACRLYSKQTAKLAVIIYMFPLHGILNNFDVRAEPYLTTLTIGAIYYFYRACTTNKWMYVVLTALLSACAVMTKGIFTLITISAGFIIYWCLTQNWKQFINVRWWVMLLLILVFTFPELYSLYTQFDLHPEKMVFGKHHVSGVWFFFWDSQFGRFFNTGPIKGRGDVTFFLHTTLWAFLPWAILLYCAVFRLFKTHHTSKDKIRWIVYGSATVTFLLFSLSRFQLPHYITILFPQFAIITAAYLLQIERPATLNTLGIVQQVLLVLAAVAVSVLCWFTKFGNLPAVVATILVLTIATLLLSGKGIQRVVMAGVGFSLVLFAYLHNAFYPKLLQYQSGMMAGKWASTKTPGKNAGIVGTTWMAFSFDFYSPKEAEWLDTKEKLDNFIAADSSRVVCTTNSEITRLTSEGYKVQVLKAFPHFHISVLTGKFLNPDTRSSQLDELYIVSVKKAEAL